MNEENLTALKNEVTKKAEEILLQYKYSEMKLNLAKEKFFKKIEEFNSYLDQDNAKKSKEFCTVFAQ